MPNLNKVMLIGHLTRDPHLSTTGSNTKVCNFSLAINRYWNTPDGDKQHETTYIDAVAWARMGEIISANVKKGRPLYIGGRLRLDTWETDGVKRSKIVVVVEEFEFLDSQANPKPTNSGRRRPSSDDRTGRSQPRPATTRDDDDIPF